MEMNQALKCYLIAKKNYEESKVIYEKLKLELKADIKSAYDFDIIQGLLFEKSIENITGFAKDKEDYQRAEAYLIEVFQKETNNPEIEEKLKKYGFKLHWIQGLFNEKQYYGIRILITEIAVQLA